MLKNCSFTFSNPLIEQGHFFSVKEIKEENNLPLKIPKVILSEHNLVINIPLSIPDEELVKIGKEGIMNENGICRGPLARSRIYESNQNLFSKLDEIQKILNLNL